MAEKHESYSELEETLKNLPVTWYPALITVMVKAAYEKRVFIPGKASVFVRNTCEKDTEKSENEKD